MQIKVLQGIADTWIIVRWNGDSGQFRNFGLSPAHGGGGHHGLFGTFQFRYQIANVISIIHNTNELVKGSLRMIVDI